MVINLNEAGKKRGHFDEDDLRYIRKEIKQGGR